MTCHSVLLNDLTTSHLLKFSIETTEYLVEELPGFIRRDLPSFRRLRLCRHRVENLRVSFLAVPGPTPWFLNIHFGMHCRRRIEQLKAELSCRFDHLTQVSQLR